MKHYLRFILVLLLSTVWCVGGYSQETVTDELTSTSLNLSKKSYSSFSATFTSGSVYTGTAYVGSGKQYYGIQIKTSGKTSGIVTKSSVGKIKSISIYFNKDCKGISVYGKNTAYDLASDLFNSKKQGDLIRNVKYSSSVVEIIPGPDYKYVGFCSNDGAAYINKITIVWEKESSKTPTTTTFGADVDKHTYPITEGEIFPTHVATTTAGVAGTIEYSSDNAAVKVDQNGVTSAGTGFGKAKITATFIPTDAETYASSSAYYYIDYKEKTKPATAISFDKSNVTLTTLDYASFTGQTATLKAGETILTNELAYSKEDAAGVISTLNNNDGTLVLSGKAGTATVTAKFAGNDKYASSFESYTITVRKVYGDIAELKKVLTTTAEEYSLNLKDAVVTGIYDNKDRNGNFNVYIEDASAGILIFYPNANNGFKVGQKINGEVTIKGKTYNSLPEITSWTATESCTVVDGADVPLTTVTIAELSANFDKYESRRVKIENATVTTGTTSEKENGKIAQGESEMTLRTNAVAVTTTKDDVIDVIGYPATYRSYQQFSVWSQDDVIVKSSVVKTTLSFDPATTEYNVDNNNKDTFKAPTATVKDAEGNIVEGAAITYTSSKPSVATVGETDGKLTFVGFGTTVITANYAGDATHMASSNSYTINYGKVKTTMSWLPTEVTANLGETFTAPTLTLKAGDTDILAGKTIIYSSSATDVAEISAEGIVKLNAEGTTVITATFEGDDTYAEASASYTLTVTDPNKLEVTFDFTKASDYGYNVSTGTPDGPDGKGDVPVTGTIKSGIVTITNLKNSTTANTTFYADNLRIYKGAETSISVPEGYVLKKITSDAYIYSSATWSNGNKGTDDKEWVATEDVNSVTFTANSSIKMANLTVYYAKVDLPTVTFDEEKDDNYKNLSDYDKKTVDVTMKRTIGTGYLNPVCFPFAMDATQITEVFGEGSKVSSMSMEMPDGNLHFDYVETMEAGKPYLVEPTKASTTIEIKNVKINAVDLKPGSDVAEDNDGNMYLFQGTFEPYAFTTTDGTELFLGKDNTLYMPQSAGQRMKGFRAYFTTTKANGSLKVVVNGQTTTISSLMSGKTMTGKVYNLNGQYVGTSLEGLAKGVYVMNGQKFVVK